MTAQRQKQAAALEAAKQIQNGQLVGLGTGSTVRFFLEALAQRIEAGTLRDIVGISTSLQTESISHSLNIATTTLEDHPPLDVCVDGADEVDPKLNLIKGLGGALMREKIVAAASERFVIIIDQSKQVAQLGQRSPLPVEVLPFGWQTTANAIQTLGGKPILRQVQDRPYTTDQNNYVLDCAFNPIEQPKQLAQALDAIPGVLSHGLFLDMTHEVIIGADEGTHVLTR